MLVKHEIVGFTVLQHYIYNVTLVVEVRHKMFGLKWNSTHTVYGYKGNLKASAVKQWFETTKKGREDFAYTKLLNEYITYTGVL